jgi:hypothetical protein
MVAPVLPFSVRVLERGLASDDLSHGKVDFALLLPATSRNRADDIVAPQPGRQFLEKELCVTRLNDVHEWLWLCGRPMPPRPLHHQRLLCREICITEDVGLHLVWWRHRIFIKPLPAYLLSPDFWAEHLLDDDNVQGPKACSTGLSGSARGFLFSYTALIAYESDFHVAKECGLLPAAVTWQDWKALTAELLANHSYDSINPRYWYGELRLSRLNKLFRLFRGSLFRGYSRVVSHSFFSSFLEDQFALLAGILGYVVIMLTALQVGLGVDDLQQSRAFQYISYALTVFSLVAPLIGAVVIFVVLLAMYLNNWKATKIYERKRFYNMGVDPVENLQRSDS